MTFKEFTLRTLAPAQIDIHGRHRGGSGRGGGRGSGGGSFSIHRVAVAVVELVLQLLLRRWDRCSGAGGTDRGAGGDSGSIPTCCCPSCSETLNGRGVRTVRKSVSSETDEPPSTRTRKRGPPPPRS